MFNPEMLENAVGNHLAVLALLSKPMAYLDPGTGSFLLQLLAAGVLGGLFVLRSSWSKIRNFFLRLMGRPVPVEDEDEDEDDE